MPIRPTRNLAFHNIRTLTPRTALNSFGIIHKMSTAPQTAAATSTVQPNGTAVNSSSSTGGMQSLSKTSWSAKKQSQKLADGGADKLDVWSIFT
jgi:hypothetical protein